MKNKIAVKVNSERDSRFLQESALAAGYVWVDGDREYFDIGKSAYLIFESKPTGGGIIWHGPDEDDHELVSMGEAVDFLLYPSRHDYLADPEAYAAHHGLEATARLESKLIVALCKKVGINPAEV